MARAPSESEWVLATTVDSATAADLVSAYGTRWSIEVAFKALKSALGLRALACRSAVAVRHVIEAFCLFSLVVALERNLRPPLTLAPREPRRRVPGCDPRAVPEEERVGAEAVLRSAAANANAVHLSRLVNSRRRRRWQQWCAALVRELADAQGVLVEGVRSIAALAAGGADTAYPTRALHALHVAQLLLAVRPAPWSGGRPAVVPIRGSGAE